MSVAKFALERAVAIKAVQNASELCRAVFNKLVDNETIVKNDKSPVTIADYSSQAIINSVLHNNFPKDNIVGEEDAKSLMENQDVLSRVVELTNSVLEKKMTEEEVLQSIDRGKYEGGSKGRFWTLDPIDGTKGFIRGGQYAICLALIEDGIVKLGVIGCPNLPFTTKQGQEKKGCMFIAVENQGAYQRGLDSDQEEVGIKVNSDVDLADSSFCESVESGHSDQTVSNRIASLLNITKPPIRMDSQCKYGAIARGQAEVYLRLPTVKNYEEKIWDHAAGNVLVQEAGGIVTDISGLKLDFSRGRTLVGNKGIIASNPRIHAKVLECTSLALKEGRM